MPYHKVEVTEYECAKCSHKWINWADGKEGPKPKRCAKCKRWDWDQGYLSWDEKHCRRDILHEKDYYIPRELCSTFFGLYPRPTEEELKTVLNPISYLGPYCEKIRDYDYNNGEWIHISECAGQPSYHYHNRGYRPILSPDKPGLVFYKSDDKVRVDMIETEKDTRRQLIQHIIDSRGGIVDVNSKHYQYFWGAENHLMGGMEDKGSHTL